MTMNEFMVIQGRRLQSSDLDFIRELIRDNPSWNRTNISKEICKHWDWRRPNGQLKDIACRSMMRKLQDLELITLPEPLYSGHHKRKIVHVSHDTEPILEPLSALRPIRIKETHSSRDDDDLFCHLLHRYHYLGLRATFVGENIRYLAYDNHDRPVGCLLFGSAAWKTHPRDTYIGWSASTRKQNLSMLTNNTRFLVLPWVQVKSLASHLLSLSLKRLNHDWQSRYGHSISLVETFVDTTRFCGTCYKAANWVHVGQTKGRSRQDRHSNMKVPIKDIYLYPLRSDFKRTLCRI
jgi:hypothetical protein